MDGKGMILFEDARKGAIALPINNISNLSVTREDNDMKKTYQVHISTRDGSYYWPGKEVIADKMRDNDYLKAWINRHWVF